LLSLALFSNRPFVGLKRQLVPLFAANNGRERMAAMQIARTKAAVARMADATAAEDQICHCYFS
jgi:hypothetical protein